MSMKEIAKMTGLSIATVSHAINGTRKVSDKSLALIHNAAEEIGYKPSLAAQILRTQKSGIIALIIPSSHPTNDTNSFYFGVLNGARAALERSGYDMIVSTYPESSAKINIGGLRVIQTRMVDGIMLVPHSSDPTSLKYLDSVEVPVVLLDREVEGSALPVVKSSNEKSAYDLVSLMISSGRRRIAFLGGRTSYSTVLERLGGYKRALSDHNIPIDAGLIITQLPDQESKGYSATEKIIALGADAVFIENSMLIIGAIDFCNRHNINVPQQLAVAGFDNASWMNITSPPITAIQQNAEAIGEKGAELLLDLINGSPVDSRHITIPTTIVERKSHN